MFRVSCIVKYTRCRHSVYDVSQHLSRRRSRVLTTRGGTEGPQNCSKNDSTFNYVSKSFYHTNATASTRKSIYRYRFYKKIGLTEKHHGKIDRSIPPDLHNTGTPNATSPLINNVGISPSQVASLYYTEPSVQEPSFCGSRRLGLF